MSNYPQVMARLTNTPLMVCPVYLETVLRFMGTRSEQELMVYGSVESTGADFQEIKDKSDVVAKPSVRLIDISGSLAHKSGRMEGMSSTMRSYEDIQAEFDIALADESVKGIALMIDSPGGEVSGNFSLVRHMVENRGNKPTVAIINEFATSAAYNIAAAADYIVGPPEMYVGSIGVITSHVSLEDALDQRGIKVTMIHAGKHKADGHQYADLPKNVLKDMQARVDGIRENFAQLVADNRGLSLDAVLETEARYYNGTDALELGLVDQIMSVDQALENFTAQTLSAPKQETIMSTDEKTFTQAEVDAQVKAATAAGTEAGKAETEAAYVDSGVKAVTAERERVTAIYQLESANQSDSHKDLAVEYAAMGLSVEAADNLLKKQAIATVAEPPEDTSDPFSESMEKDATDNPGVDAVASTEDGDPKLADAIASAMAFKSATEGYTNYANKE